MKTTLTTKKKHPKHYIVATLCVLLISRLLGCLDDSNFDTTRTSEPIREVIVVVVIDAMKPPPVRLSHHRYNTKNNPFVHTTTTATVPYILPHWCQKYFTHPPKHGRFSLANLPTPLYRVSVPTSTTTTTNDSTNPTTSSVGSILQKYNCTLYIKRDDCTHGIELGGNKIRKLEFLLAEAVALKHDAIITIGGIQSNHCRATACMTRMIGLQPHLILRQSSSSSSVNRSGTNAKNELENDVGLVGNLLFDRMVGSRIYTCTPGEYGRVGSTELLDRVTRYIQTEEHQNPYIIPVGGSNGVGTWGYINAVDELLTQWNDLVISKDDEEDDDDSELHHIVVACGSGGTTAGIALGIALAHYHFHHEPHQHEVNDNNSETTQNIWNRNPSSKPPIVHAIGVCDDADYFYKHIAKIADEMGFVVPHHKHDHFDPDRDSSTTLQTTEQYIRQHLVIHQGKGRGYGQSTKEELDFIIQFAQDTGIVLDPVYTGKALYNFFQYLQEQSTLESSNEHHPRQNILFWHTGGGLGLFDKCNDMIDTLVQHAPCRTLDLYGNGNGIDIRK